MKGKAFFLWLLLFVFTLATIGCTKDQSSGSPSQKKGSQNPESVNRTETAANVIENIPIPIEEGVFNKVFGWLDPHTILYATSVGHSSNVYAYNLNKGKNRLITKSESMIASIDISDSGKYLFIRSSSKPSDSIITIMKPDGTLLFRDSFEAFDLTMEWNPYNEQQIFISSFTEDWQEKTFLFSIAEKKITEVESADPFSHWLAEDQLIFLNWIGEDVTLSADLIMQDLVSGQEKKLFSNIIHMDTFKDVLMTITMDQDSTNKSIYQFYQKDLKLLGSFVTPQLSSFSDRLIPYYDYNHLNKAFISFQPLVSKEMENQKDKFQLFKYDFASRQQIFMMDGLKNEPLSCSPDGNLCLYGYNFEKLIDLNRKKVMKLTS